MASSILKEWQEDEGYSGEEFRDMTRTELRNELQGYSLKRKLLAGIQVAEVDLAQMKADGDDLSPSDIARNLISVISAQNKKINRLESQLEMAEEKIHEKESKNNAIR